MRLSRVWSVLACLVVPVIVSGEVSSGPAAGEALDAIDPIEIRRDRATGLVRAIMGAGGPAPITGLTGTPLMSAEEFLAERGGSFGVDDPATELRLHRRTTDNLGWTTSEYRQVFRETPVFSGVLKVHQDEAGRVVGANGAFRIIPEKLSNRAALTADQAEAAARFALGEVPNARLVARELFIVDPGWYGDRPRGPRAAWLIELADDAIPVHASFFIDANTGDVLDAWSRTNNFRERYVFDGLAGPDLPGTLVRLEGDPAIGDYDADAAYDYYGDTYDYFFRAFGRDGIDDQGYPMVATVHSNAYSCPNAFWSPSLGQMVFCDGMVTDDIIGHELTHGLTQVTADLIYQNQSGQLSESFSDVFGELVDLFNGDVAFAGPPGGTPWTPHATGPGNDLPNNARTFCTYHPDYQDGVRWLIGEDAVGSGGARRDMWRPICYAHADHADDVYQDCPTYDYGGVHFGSGVPNHALVLATDGGTFLGVSVSGIGPIKTGAVWYRALTTYLTISSDFEDAYWAFNRAASDLVGTTPNDPRTGLPSASVFTEADAAEIDNALLAVRMDGRGVCGETIDVLNWDFTPSFSEGTPFFTDDFDGPALQIGGIGWTSSSVVPDGQPYNWALTTGDLPYGREGRAYFITNDVGFFGEETGQHWLESPPIAIPGGAVFPILAFDHHVECEWLWDGGRVAISVNGQPWTEIQLESFMLNGYNEVLYSPDEGNTNAWAGQAAFSGAGGRWGTSIVDLRELVAPGDSVRVRFEFAKDFCCGTTGWWIDDVRLYDMGVPADCDDSGTPDFAEDPGSDPSLLWSRRPAFGTAYRSDTNAAYQPQLIATRVHLAGGGSVERLRLWGAYFENYTPPANFTVEIMAPDELDPYYPGAAVYTESNVQAAREFTGDVTLGGLAVWKIDLTLATPPNLAPGAYWVLVRDDTTGTTSPFFWMVGGYNIGFASLAFSTEGPPSPEWILSGQTTQMSLELVMTPPGCPVDLDCDADVDIYDFGAFLLAFGATEDELRYDIDADYDGDGQITMFDFSYFAPAFGCGKNP